MFKDEHVVPCESIHHHLWSFLLIFHTLPEKKSRLLWNYESGMILVIENQWKTVKNIYTPPFKLSIFDLFWQCPATFGNFSPEENSWNQLNNNFFLYPWWTDIIWSILYSKWDMYFQNRTCYIYEFLMSHNGMHYFFMYYRNTVKLL